MLETIGYGPGVARAFAPWAADDALVGRVVRVLPGAVSVLCEDGLRRASLGGPVLGEVAAHPVAAPCAGDWVVLRRWPDRRVTLESVLPRRTTVLSRGGAGDTRAVCANVDVVAVPGPARPGREEQLRRQSRLDRVAAAAPGVEVVGCGHRDVDVERLRDLIAGRRTLALVGGGRARAALVRSIVGTEVLPACEGPGLVAVPGGGALVDVPGLVGLDEDAGSWSGTGL